MKIGVTGASGLVGSALCRRLDETGHEVIGFSRNPGRTIPHVVTVREFAGDRPPQVADLDAVVHLAGESILGIWTEEKKRRILESRVGPTTALVRVMAEAGESGPRILISASGVGVYGDRGDDELTEESPDGDGFLAEVVRAWEGAAFAAPSFVRTVALRFGMILSGDGGALPTMARVFKLGLGGRIGDGRQWMPWVHVDDVVGLVEHALATASLSGPCNTVSPGAVRNAEFTAVLGDVLARPAVIPVPRFLVAGVLREMAALLLDSARVRPAVAMASGYAFRYPDLRTALKAALEVGSP